MMLPLAEMAHGSATTLFGPDEENTGVGIGVEMPDDGALPEYPGALVGLWCPSGEAKRSGGSRPQQTWVLEIPVGWLETTVTLAYEPDGKVQNSSIRSVDVLFDGKSAGRLQPLIGRGSNALDAGWLGLNYVSKGPHELSLAFDTDPGSKLIGVWVTNGPLSFWPGDPMVLSADRSFWPGKLRIVPRPPDAGMPLEFGRQGLASHINEQGMIGIADSRMTAVPRSLRLRYSDAELNVLLKTNEGLRRVKDLCPDFHFNLLDGFLPCPVAHFTYDDVRYAVTFAAVPEDAEAADMVHVAAWNLSSEPHPNRLEILLDTAADMAVDGNTVMASNENIAYFGGSSRARQATRPVGYNDPRAQPVGVFLAPYVDPSSMEWDVSLYSSRVSWGKKPVSYSLRCPPGERYVVYLGLIKLSWPGSYSVSQVSILEVEGAKAVRADARDFVKPAQNASAPAAVFNPDLSPTIFRFDACDENHDGILEICSTPPAEIEANVASIASIWVFSAGTSVDTDLLRRGKLQDKPLHHINVGGSAVSWYIDIFPNEDWSSKYVDISSNRTIPGGGKDEFWVAMPVNHRGEVFSTGAPRAWKEGDEDTPAYLARVKKRLAAAQIAKDSPAKALEKVREYWAQSLASTTRLAPPEDSVMNLALTSNCYFRILRYPLGGDAAVPMGGDALDYFDFSERDSAYEIAGLDATGHHDQAESFLNIYLARKGELKTPRWPLGQDDQGMWMTRSHEEDTEGLVLWALGEHYMLSRDKVWLARAWPWIKRGLEYIRRTRAAANVTIHDKSDPRYGLWVTGSGEMMADEPSYWYWYNYFIETGLRYGVVEAEAMGEKDYARTLRDEHADFIQCLRRSMRQRFNRLDYRRGLLPGRANGDQLLDVALSEGSVFPSHSLEPNDPMVTLSLGYTDAVAWARGGSFPVTWYGSNGSGIWPALTGDYAMMHLRRGEPEKVLDCFYAMLSTCGRINSWGEVMSWDNGFSTGGQPYMWANGIFLILLRNMLLHEEGEWLTTSPAGPRELWICPATPRKWMHEPRGIVVEHAPTYFGPVSFSLRAQDGDHATATIEFEGREAPPERLVVYVRSLRDRSLRQVTVNGKDHASYTGDQIVIGNPPRKLEIVCSS
jgi:GH15 family glucan-1,4-alpha-glucosidase